MPAGTGRGQVARKGFKKLSHYNSRSPAIGTREDEKSLGLDEVRTHLERDLAQSEAISIEPGWTSVSAAGSVAWVAGDGIIHVKASGQEISFPGRFTAVLEQREGRWLIVQRHFSVPNPEQAEGESFPTK